MEEITKGKVFEMKVKINDEACDVKVTKDCANTKSEKVAFSILINDWYVLAILKNGKVARCKGIGRGSSLQLDEKRRIKIAQGEY